MTCTRICTGSIIYRKSDDEERFLWIIRQDIINSRWAVLCCAVPAINWKKKGKKGIWEDASDQLWRFYSGDDDLIEISPEEAGEDKE